ncbi:MAG: hypothetical protein K2G23_08465, partial [Muribaculaceae bacterium]|nr:hypothetical protein [Muribaculaceae bacterium]
MKTKMTTSIVYMFIILILFGCGHSAHSSKADTDTISVSEIGNEAASIDVGELAVTDLYRCYYSKDMLSGNGDYGSYSNDMKKIFSARGINSSIDDPFSKSFQTLIDQAEEVADKYDDIIIDSDLQWGGQDIPGNYNIEVTEIEVKDDDHVCIKTKVTNYDNTRPWEFLMVRENGTFKIDDIIDGESTRKFLQDEIKRVKQYHESTTQDFKTYKGNVGEYEIEMKLQRDAEADAMVRCIGVTGSYKYTKDGKTLNLSGVVEEWPGMDSETDMHKYPIYVLTETTPAGNETGEWVLYT